jgi:hypothetical protein
MSNDTSPDLTTCIKGGLMTTFGGARGPARLIEFDNGYYAWLLRPNEDDSYHLRIYTKTETGKLQRRPDVEDVLDITSPMNGAQALDRIRLVAHRVRSPHAALPLNNGSVTTVSPSRSEFEVDVREQIVLPQLPRGLVLQYKALDWVKARRPSQQPVSELVLPPAAVPA